jgi:acyl-CoA synthetase (NDP forming)
MGFDFAQIDDILNARSIAIVGASNSPLKIGSLLTASQLNMGFTGTIYLVNPNEAEVLGRRAYRDLLSLPEPPELVYIVIPADRSLEVLRHCGEVGVKGVVMVSSGFREAGEEGEALEREALRLARQGGFRIIGPNCFGIYNPRNRLTLLPGPDFSTSPGDVAFLAQSGGLASHIARLGKSLGIRFSAVVSYGNGVDIDETDLLRYFGRDPRTGVIGAYLEGVRDGRAFLEALKEAASRKPVIMWKVGKAAASRQAVMSHTGSLAGSAEIWEAAFRQAGVIQASGIDEVCDVLVALRHLGTGPGGRILVSGGGGGLGTNAADLAGLAGLDIPALNKETEQALKRILGRAGAVVSNPLDIGTPLIPLPMFEAAMREAASNPTTDLLIFDLAVNFALGLVGEEGLHLFADILIRIRRECGKPLVMVLYSRACDPDDLGPERLLRQLRAKFLEGGVPVFPSMRRAIRAIRLANTSVRGHAVGATSASS